MKPAFNLEICDVTFCERCIGVATGIADCEYLITDSCYTDGFAIFFNANRLS
jgi:hypothetical protein